LGCTGTTAKDHKGSQLELRKVVLLAVLFSQGIFSAKADAPLPLPIEWRTCNRPVTLCARMTPEKDTVVYKVDRNFSGSEMYRIPGWHRDVFLSDDGQYFASGYGGLNLVQLDATPTTVMLTVWKNGQPHMFVSLGQVLRSITSLKRTTMHYFWGRNLGFRGDAVFEMETVENRQVTVDPEKKSIKIWD
jgi:hypothetical protein